MAIKFGRWRLGRWLTGGERDPLWNHFIYHTPADPNNNLTPALQGAQEGRIYPVKTEVSDPLTMSQQIKEFGQWLGADLVGIAALQPAHQRSGGRPDVPYPFAVVCAIATDYDPTEAKGLGGQLAVQNGALVNHHLRNYIRELGYRASIGGADAVAVAVAAGLGTLDRHGRLVTKMHSSYMHVADTILTDLPLAPDAPQS
jgi:Reductive dehalogenase subunit